MRIRVVAFARLRELLGSVAAHASNCRTARAPATPGRLWFASVRRWPITARPRDSPSAAASRRSTSVSPTATSWRCCRRSAAAERGVSNRRGSDRSARARAFRAIRRRRRRDVPGRRSAGGARRPDGARPLVRSPRGRWRRREFEAIAARSGATLRRRARRDRASHRRRRASARSRSRCSPRHRTAMRRSRRAATRSTSSNAAPRSGRRSVTPSGGAEWRETGDA